MKRKIKSWWLAVVSTVCWTGAVFAADIRYVADNGGGEYSGSGYGISVFGSSGRVIFPNGRPVHGLAFLVRDAFALTNQVLVPSLQVVVEPSYRYAGLFGYFSG